MAIGYTLLARHKLASTVVALVIVLLITLAIVLGFIWPVWYGLGRDRGHPAHPLNAKQTDKIISEVTANDDSQGTTILGAYYDDRDLGLLTEIRLTADTLAFKFEKGQMTITQIEQMKVIRKGDAGYVGPDSAGQNGQIKLSATMLGLPKREYNLTALQFWQKSASFDAKNFFDHYISLLVESDTPNLLLDRWQVKYSFWDSTAKFSDTTSTYQGKVKCYANETEVGELTALTAIENKDFAQTGTVIVNTTSGDIQFKVGGIIEQS